MSDSFDYLEWFNLDNVQQLSQDNSLTFPTQTQQEVDYATSTNTEIFQYLLDNEMNATNYEASSEPITESSMVIAPTELLKSVGAVALPHFVNPFPSPSVDGSPDTFSESDFDMTEVKEEFNIDSFDTAELLRNLDARVAAITNASKTAQAQSDKNNAELQMTALATIKEEKSNEKEKDDDPPIDPKKLSSKERRQLRNKISARNFRVRRKEYISTLESQVSLQQAEARELREKLLNSEIENEKLRTQNLILQASAINAAAEMDQLRQSLKQMQLSRSTPPSSPVEHLKENSPIIKPSNTFTSRPSPTISKPNLNKDVSINGTRTGFMDTRILVSSFELPEWDVEKILEEHHARKEGLSEKPTTVTPTASILPPPAGFGPETAIIATLMVGMVAQTLMEQIMCGLVLANAPLQL